MHPPSGVQCDESLHAQCSIASSHAPSANDAAGRSITAIDIRQQMRQSDAETIRCGEAIRCGRAIGRARQIGARVSAWQERAADDQQLAIGGANKGSGDEESSGAFQCSSSETRSARGS